MGGTLIGDKEFLGKGLGKESAALMLRFYLISTQ